MGNDNHSTNLPSDGGTSLWMGQEADSASHAVDSRCGLKVGSNLPVGLLRFPFKRKQRAKTKQ